VRLIMIRHGLPLRIDRPTGTDPAAADPGLAPGGVRQARQVADFLAEERIDAIYTSPSVRAVETASPLADRLGIAATVVAEVAEWDSAGSTYVPVEELRKANDPRWQALRQGRFYDPAIDFTVFRAKVVGAVESIIRKHPGGTAVLFTHAGVINAFAGYIVGQDKAFWLALPYSPAYGSITRVIADQRTARSLISVNETGHVRHLR
jgi:probable phosphoglycerate mutase